MVYFMWSEKDSEMPATQDEREEEESDHSEIVVEKKGSILKYNVKCVNLIYKLKKLCSNFYILKLLLRRK